MSISKRIRDEYQQAKKEITDWVLHSNNKIVGEKSLRNKFASKYPHSLLTKIIDELDTDPSPIIKMSGKGIPTSRTQFVPKGLEYTASSSFIAIDFETANRSRNSACALSIVKVQNNNITKFESYLIKPPSRYFEFTNIHGISYNDVKYANSFDDIWKEISPYIDKVDFVVAHNAAFDKSVLETCCDYYDIKYPSIPFECTMLLSRELWNIRPTKLPDVCRRFNIELNHHIAASDALACAKIMLKILNRNNKYFDINSITVPVLKSDTIPNKYKPISYSATGVDTAHTENLNTEIENRRSTINYYVNNNYKKKNAGCIGTLLIFLFITSIVFNFLL